MKLSHPIRADCEEWLAESPRKGCQGGWREERANPLPQRLPLWAHLCRGPNVWEAYLTPRNIRLIGSCFPSTLTLSLRGSPKEGWNKATRDVAHRTPCSVQKCVSVFKDACPNVLKTDPRPRRASAASISEGPGQCPGSRTISVCVFVSLFFWRLFP